MQTTIKRPAVKPTAFTDRQLPAVNFKHISSLTDLTGMIQHAVFTMPNRKEGYCIDDNARALLLAVWAGKDRKKQEASGYLSVYLSFIHYMQTTDGYFRNFISYSKVAHEERGSEDSFGRTLMALGFMVNECRVPLLTKTAIDIFSKAYHHVDGLVSIRGIANSIIGICQFIKFNYPDDLKRDKVILLSNKMVSMYRETKREGWNWFEPILTYDNAMLPLALLNAYEVTQEEDYLETALEAMEFLESKVFDNGMLRPIGNQGWLTIDGGPAAKFDQQGIDAMAMVLYYQQAYRITREEKYRQYMYKSYQWFLGANDLGLSLYDPATGGCADGLHSTGINLNQGAESTLAYWISHLVVASTMEE
jgi:hypothetical protein